MELATLECYVSMPEPEIKVAQIQLKPVKDLPIVNPGFMQLEKEKNVEEVVQIIDNSNINSNEEIITLETENTTEVRNMSRGDKEADNKDKESDVECLSFTQML